MKFRRHLDERFPIHAFVINAQPAPIRVILKNLIEQLIDAGAGFARAGVAGDEPAPAKILACLSESLQLHNIFALVGFRGGSMGGDGDPNYRDHPRDRSERNKKRAKCQCE